MTDRAKSAQVGERNAHIRTLSATGPITDKRRMNDELVRFSSNTATRLSGYIADPLWGVETEQMAAAITSEMLDRQIYATHIFDQDREGILMGRVADYYELGKLAVSIVHLHQLGQDLSAIPIQTPAAPKLVINSKTMELLKLDLPNQLLSKSVLISK